MEEEKVVQKEEKVVQKPEFYLSISDQTIGHLMNIIEMSNQSVQIRTESGTVVGNLAEPFCLLFDYYETMKFSKFKDSDKKIMTLPFADEECKFFVETIPKLFTNMVSLSGKNIVWILKMFDILQIKSEIGEVFFQNISLNSYFDKIKLIDQLIIECSGKIPGNYLKRLFDEATKIEIEYDDITASMLTYSVGRNILMKSMKKDSYNCINETKLFQTIIKKVDEFNKEKDSFKISFKAFLDLMACIRWFHVDNREVLKKMELIKESYPEFELTNQMSACFERRINLAKKYAVHTKLKYFKYSDDHKKLDTRDVCAYSKNIIARKGILYYFYTTTLYPITFGLSFDIVTIKKKGESFVVVSSTISELIILIDLYTKNKEKLIISQSWTFTNGKKLFLPISNSNIEYYTVVLRLAYFTKNEPVVSL